MAAGWIRRWASKYGLFPDYITIIIRRWQEHLWGESALAAAMVIALALLHPPAWVIVLYFLLVLVLAGYFAWRVDHLRLIPKLTVTKFYIQPTNTNNPAESRVFVQILPECITEAPVLGCSGHLLRVCKRATIEEKWGPTALTEKLPLMWSYQDTLPYHTN
jgi:hypothetical protein